MTGTGAPPPGRIVLVLDRAPGWEDGPAHRALRLALKRLLRDGRWRCSGMATGDGSFVGKPPPAGVLTGDAHPAGEPAASERRPADGV